MNTFKLQIQGSSGAEQFEAVEFIGEDSSGRFGILAGYERFMTSLLFGLARFRGLDGIWHYLAIPSGLLYACDNVVTLTTRRYCLDTDYTRISQLLLDELLREEEELNEIKINLHHLEDEMMKRLWRMNRPELMP